MDATIVSAMAAVVGSVVGSSATVVTALITQKKQSKRELIRDEIGRREMLYGEFICECSRLFVDSLSRELDKPEAMLPLYALVSRIRVSASDAVVEEAERVVKRIANQYFAPNLSLEEMRALVQSDSDADPLKPFGEACRVELDSMHPE